MKLRRFSPAGRFAFAVCLLAALPACSLLHRHRPETKPAKVVHHANSRGLEFDLRVSPDPLRLGEVRELAVNITLRNVSSKSVTLKFPTTQILEMALRDVTTGAVVSRWSTDRTFAQDSRLVPINKGEHLEYSESITTRELKPGKPYNLEVYFLGYENELAAKKVLIPQP